MKRHHLPFPETCAFLLAASTLTALPPLHAADVRSPALGCLRLECPAGSDTLVSAPFHPRPRWMGTLAAAPSVPGSGRVQLSLAPAPGFEEGALTETSHFLISRDSSAAPGRSFLIVANTGTSLEIAATPGELGGLSSGSKVSVVPAWTLDSLFPPATQTTLHVSSSKLVSQRGSEILFLDSTSIGTRLAPARRFFLTAEGWLDARDFVPAGQVSLAPGEAFVIRHPAGVAATTFIPHQQVHGGLVALPVRTSAGRAQDTTVALPRPLPVALQDLDLGSFFEESAGTATGVRKDELLVFDNSAPGINKAPAKVYFRTSGAWRRDSAGFPIANGDVIPAGTALVIRKAPAASSQRLLWVNAPLYDLTAP